MIQAMYNLSRIIIWKLLEQIVNIVNIGALLKPFKVPKNTDRNNSTFVMSLLESFQNLFTENLKPIIVQSF